MVKIKPLTTKEKVLRMLRKRPKSGVTTNEFLNVYLYKFASRISDLRKAGYTIDCEYERRGNFRYYLTK